MCGKSFYLVTPSTYDVICILTDKLSINQSVSRSVDQSIFIIYCYGWYWL